jgi:hypothetical protein
MLILGGLYPHSIKISVQLQGKLVQLWSKLVQKKVEVVQLLANVVQDWF